MATELGQAYVQIMPSAKGISGSIQKQLDPEATAAGSSAGLKLGTGLKIAAVAAFAAAGLAIGKVVSSSISEGANLQQSLGGVETLFKENADKVKKYANEAYKTAGLSANEYMQSVTSFSASLLQSVGGDTSKAADIANMAMIDMSDNANKMGTSMQSIQDAYQGFAKQNYTMLDNLKLGYGGTKTEMERLLSDAEKLTGVKYDINNLSDVYDAIHAVQEELGITGTTAEEASKTLTGSLAAMKGAYKNVLGNLALGEDIKPSLKALAETTSTFLFDNFLPMVGNILKALPGAVVTFIQAAGPKFMAAGGEMLKSLAEGISKGIPDFMASFDEFLKGIANWKPSLGLRLKGALMLREMIAGLLEGIPLFVSSLQGIIETALSFITNNLPFFLEMGVGMITYLVNGILQYLPELVTVVGELINTFITFLMENIPVILEAGKNLLLNLIDGIIQNLPAIGESAIQAVSKFIDTVVANYPRYLATGWGILMSLLQGILDRLPELIATAIVLVTKFVAMLISKIPSVLAAGVQIIVGFITGIVKKIPEVISKVNSLGRDIISEITGIDLSNAGRAIIDGFLGGLKSSWGKVTDFVGGIASWIAQNKGPISYDLKLLIPAGNAIMNGLNQGLSDQFKAVQTNVLGMAGKIADVFQTEMLAIDEKKFNASGVQMDLSSNKLAGQVAETSPFAWGDIDILDTLNKLANRPIVVSNQIDKQQVSQIMARPIAEEQTRRQAILNAIDGLGW